MVQLLGLCAVEARVERVPFYLARVLDLISKRPTWDKSKSFSHSY